MFWRITHDFFKWFWPAAFGGCFAIAGIAVAASQVWPEAKAWTASSFQSVSAVMSQSWFIPLALGIFAIWLAAFLWSGHCVNKSKFERAQATATAPSQPLFLVIREFIDRHLRIHHKEMTAVSKVTASIDMVVHRAQGRDKSLAEGVAYWISGEWGKSIPQAVDVASGHLDESIAAITQLARDNEITIWGQPGEGLPFEVIPPDHWRDYMIDVLRAAFDVARSEHRQSSSPQGIYYELMVSSTQFEVKRPHA